MTVSPVNSDTSTSHAPKSTHNRATVPSAQTLPNLSQVGAPSTVPPINHKLEGTDATQENLVASFDDVIQGSQDLDFDELQRRINALERTPTRLNAAVSRAEYNEWTPSRNAANRLFLGDE